MNCFTKFLCDIRGIWLNDSFVFESRIFLHAKYDLKLFCLIKLCTNTNKRDLLHYEMLRTIFGEKTGADSISTTGKINTLIR